MKITTAQYAAQWFSIDVPLTLDALPWLCQVRGLPRVSGSRSCSRRTKSRPSASTPFSSTTILRVPVSLAPFMAEYLITFPVPVEQPAKGGM